MRIDAHQHFWTLARGDYDWLTPDLTPLYRDFGPHDIHPLISATGVEATILVQAAPTRAETEFMLSLANKNSFIKGVVGWVDFEAADATEQIDKLASHPKIVGLRPMIQDIPDPLWMLRDTLSPAFETLKRNELIFDALVMPVHLDPLQRLLDRHPDMRVVIDHGAKPAIRDQEFDSWARGMAALAQNSTADCKLSGLVTEAAPGWAIDELRPYVDHMLESFGPSRMIWGSDWPVCTLASTYEHWMDTTSELLAHLSEADRKAILGGNAARAYALHD